MHACSYTVCIGVQWEQLTIRAYFVSFQAHSGAAGQWELRITCITLSHSPTMVGLFSMGVRNEQQPPAQVQVPLVIILHSYNGRVSLKNVENDCVLVLMGEVEQRSPACTVHL